MYQGFDILVVGAGISGSVIAERFANQGKKVLVIDKRDHLGGNCFDYQNQYGIRVSKYGAHIFHTNGKKVWQYLQNFSKWRNYEHKVLTNVDGKLFPLPINIETINRFFNIELQDSQEMKSFLSKKIDKTKLITNSKDWALNHVGQELYEEFFENYSKKQWGLDLAELDPSVLSRLPIRYNHDNRYFSDKYQALPVSGFTNLFKKMLSSENIKLQLNTDYFNIKNQLPKFEKVFYTGPIDKYFAYQYGALEYRSLNIQFEDYQKKYYQKNAVINYPNENIPYTRIVEYKYFYPTNSNWTSISKEYPVWGGEAFYPVPRKKNALIYEKYRQAAKKLETKGIYFLGRLATYRYINMDQAFGEALNLFKKINLNQSS